MKEYDFILIGTGSGLEIATAAFQENPNLKAAVIDKDEPGGICLTRGCIPSKILIYNAELVRIIEKSRDFGITSNIQSIDFQKIMNRMRAMISTDIESIRQGLSTSKNIDYYTSTAEFVGPYKLKVGNETITSRTILLCIGSRPIIPPISGLESAGYLTSDTVLKIQQLPKTISIVGAGYIAAEYGHFLASMGSQVTIIGRNPQFIPEEEPEISALAKKELQKRLTILTNNEVRRAEKTLDGKKKLFAFDRANGKETSVVADEILIASGRSPNTDLLHTEKTGIRTDKNGWIVVNEYMETSKPGIWALGDADGKYLFKHVANYEALIVYFNAFQKRNVKVDYSATPHAVFTEPEIASVGLKEQEAIDKFGEDNIRIGVQRYEDTAKGEAMGLKDCFAKVIILNEGLKILGAHIIGPCASTLIQEVVNLMNTADQSAQPLIQAMHIHPALSEVVVKAFGSLMPPKMYHHVIEEHYGLSTA